MRFACRALEEEEKRSEKYLLAKTRTQLMEILTQVLVVNNAELIRSCSFFYIRNSRVNQAKYIHHSSQCQR